MPQPEPARKVVPAARELRQERRKAQERFLAGRKAEHSYLRALRGVARQVGELASTLGGGTLEAISRLRDALEKYADLLRPWAEKVAARMVEEVSRRDKQAWQRQARTMGWALAREIAETDTGEVFRKMMAEQVDLITSLPRGAAEKVHQWVIGGISEGERPAAIEKRVQRLGHITESRARLIARTETARATTMLTAARAENVGSEYFVWRTAEDENVRPLHRKLDGKVFRWDSPPVAGENGERALPGGIYNCRCYPEPILPDLA